MTKFLWTARSLEQARGAARVDVPRDVPRRIVLIAFASGTGKTTLARTLADASRRSALPLHPRRESLRSVPQVHSVGAMVVRRRSRARGK